jgi:S-DNA-T family DNA segregation ATPase FtsK/SpoIIIE
MFIRRDALVGRIVKPFTVPAIPNFTALLIGLREDLEPYALRLLASHLLVAGASRAGKGSVIWSIIRALAGGIGSGLVQLWGVDPKGGMELALGQALFTRYEFDDYQAMADLFDQAVMVMRRRQAVLRGKVREHTPTPAEPLYVIVIDELSALTAYLQDGDLKARILHSLGLVLSQGAGLGVLVVAATQDPRKETVALRDLFQTRIALALNEANHVNLILGDNARERGALCDQIPNIPAYRGIGYVWLDGHPEPARVRFTYHTDDDIRTLAATHPAAPELVPARTPPTGDHPPAPGRQRYRPSSLTGGPLLPAGLLDALAPNGSDDQDQP